MVMVVQCKCCLTEYRLDEKLLKGAKGAFIRCPKCRERIIVGNPGSAQVAPPVPHRSTPPTAPSIENVVPPPIDPPVPLRDAPPVASPTSHPIVPATPSTAVETGTPTIRVSVPRGITLPVPRYRRAEGADLSTMIRSEPLAGVSDGTVVSPAPNAISASIISRGTSLRPEESFIPPSVVEGDWIPDVGDDGPMAIRPPGPGWKPPPRRPLYRRPLFLAVAISILLLAGGAFYFVDGIAGRKSSGSVTPARARSAPENVVIDVGNLKGYLYKKASDEPLYIVKGTVTNAGKALSSGIRIEATLLGRDNEVIVKNGTFAGNVIDESLISHMSRVRIENILGMRYGDGDVNRDIPAGKTLLFMVVFFDPPKAVESFRVKAIDAEEADRIDSPDGKEPGTRASNQRPIRVN